MIELEGKYNKAKIFIDEVDEKTISQVYNILNHREFKDTIIRIMPDTHAGKGSVIGFTAYDINSIIPNIIGVDISCGMLSVNLGNIDIDFEKLDNYIRNNIPNGANVNNKKQFKDDKLEGDIISTCNRIAKDDDVDRHILSVGSLGGGNHFIEISKDKYNNKWLIIHSGSRNFGLKIAKYHQDIAEKYCIDKRKELINIRDKKAGELKQQKLNPKSIFDEYEKLIEKYKVDKDLSFLESKLAEDYINDMEVAIRFANKSRECMAKNICNFIGLDFNKLYSFETLHNYYDKESKTIRKGAVSAKKDEILLIPLNMRDGSLLCKGKGNSEWNFSAPHGAGRILSRSQAKAVLNMDEFKSTMSEVYSNSISSATLDEAPMAYKSMDVIIKNIGDTVEILDILKPVYNFKASE
jgi:tRNA-splicing ligase RtcB (3'-phosphate/5'-hydroxy nucleic acid ligase)